MRSDWELLQDFVKTRSDAAFTELVERHIDWVYSVALRRVGESHLAEDIVQSVFALLARKAGSLRRGTLLGGWLFRSTCLVAKCSLRANRRRKRREEQASAMMTTAQAHDDDPQWEQLAPHLDEAVASLSETDRSAVVLRFYQKKSLSEVGLHLGISEEAAKKRVSRTVDKLKTFMARRGVGLGGVVLAGMLAEKTVQAAPAALAGSVAKTSAVISAALLPQLARDALNAWRWTRIKWVSGVSVLLVAVLWLNSTRTSLSNQAELRLRTARASPGSQTVPALPNQAEASQASSIAGKPEFLFRAVAAESTNGIAAARVLVNYVSDAEWIRKDDLLTDDQGFCAVPLPAGNLGRLDVGIIKDGFAQKFYTWRVDYETPLPPVYVLKLERAVSMGGRVQGPDGKPVSNAEIGLSFYGAGDASFREPTLERLGFVGEAVTAVRTDSQGAWRCALIPAGCKSFSIVVQHPAYVQASFSLRPDQLVTSDKTQLPMEDLLASKAVLQLEPGFALKGYVLDDSGNPLADARVSWMGELGYRQDGVKTGPDGSFCMTSLPAGPGQISAWAKGFAPALVTVEVGASSREAIFRLNRGAAFPITIQDRDGNGIAGAWATIDLPIPHNADFHLATDAAGRAIFQGIPTNALKSLVFHAGAKGYFISRNIRLSSEQPEPTIRLVKALHVSGNVLDADSGKPVMDFKAIPCRGETSAGYDRYGTAHGQLGVYAVSFSESEPPFRVRVEADGYEPAMSPPLNAEPNEQEQDFRLRRKEASHVISGTVALPDGKPAANVGVALLTFEQGAALYHGTFKHEDGAILTTTSEQGEFKFDVDAQAHTLVAAEPQRGFGLLRIHRASAPYKLQLQPWGRIEGRLVLAGKPASGQQVTVQRGLSAYRTIRDGLYAGFDYCPTDADGRFVCELVPPGDVTLYLYEGKGQPFSHATVAEVRAGETVHVQVGGGGRTVTGKLAMNGGSKVDWASQLISGSLVTNRKRPAIEPPKANDFGARLKLLDFFDQSEEWHAFERGGGSFPLQVGPDGSFLAQNIPPGPYQLNVMISDSSGKGSDPLAAFHRNIMGSLRAEVEVPGDSNDSTAVDLGSFNLRPNQAALK